MRIRRIVTSSVVALAMTASVAASPAAAEEVELPVTPSVSVDVEDGSAATSVVDEGLDAEVVVDFDAETESDEVLELESVEIDAVVDGEEIVEELLVEDFVLLGESDFTATLRLASTGEVLHVDTTVVQEQAFPVLYVLGVLARLGIKHVITWIGKTQIKKAVKSYLLNSLNANKWAHIMAPKHKWGTVGARSRDQVADLMGRAMAEGSHSAYGSGAMQSVWRYNGRTIVVTYSKSTGKVSNGWVR